MDIYTFCFIVSTLWVGPFWFAMLFNPLDDKTLNLMSKSLFFIGPIIIWYLIMFLNPSGFVDFINSGSHPDGFFAGIASSMSTKAGVTAMWAHMVVGDIFVTKWIWSDGVKKNNNIWVMRLSIFFGVMLMPLGILIHLVFGKKN
tara:strand:- start:1615 stop:2046 length:432 start_codon:yes stop_codon:yes gene_type:complete